MWRTLRWPLLAVAISGLLAILAFWLDTGGAAGRDVALVVGSVALYVLIPLSLLWLAFAAIRHGRRTR
jgi:hypothetical protein